MLPVKTPVNLLKLAFPVAASFVKSSLSVSFNKDVFGVGVGVGVGVELTPPPPPQAAVNRAHKGIAAGNARFNIPKIPQSNNRPGTAKDSLLPLSIKQLSLQRKHDRFIRGSGHDFV